MLFTALLASNLEGVGTSFMQADKCALFFMFLAVDGFRLGLSLLVFHLIYY